MSLRIIGAAFAFAASLVTWCKSSNIVAELPNAFTRLLAPFEALTNTTADLWFSMILDSVDFPIALPVGDLSKYIKGRAKKESAV